MGEFLVYSKCSGTHKVAANLSGLSRLLKVLKTLLPDRQSTILRCRKLLPVVNDKAGINGSVGPANHPIRG